MKSINQNKVFYYFLLLILVVSISSCKKNSDPEPTTVTDVDGNVYPILKIGTQTWMTENLRTSKYNDGSAISTSLNNTDWSSTTTGAYTIYDNNASNNTTYGKLYNWHAVNTAKLAPKGWHIPTQEEWEVLITFLGGSVAGGKMKSTSSLWEAPNTGASNSSGFNGLPSGYRSKNGPFGLLGKSGYWWASSERNSTQGDYFLLDNDFNSTAMNGATKSFGYSVRCIKD